MVTEYAKVRISSQKILNLYEQKYNRTHNESLTIRDFCFMYDRFQRIDQEDPVSAEHRERFLTFVRNLAIESERLIDERINAIQTEYDLAKEKYIKYGSDMFDHVPRDKPTIFAAFPHIADVIWTWRVIFRVLTVMNKCQYYTILCEIARSKKIISRNKLSNEFRQFYVAPIQRILYETENWVDLNGDVPGYNQEVNYNN